MPDFIDTRKTTTCTRTCTFPGCTNKIRYPIGDTTHPLYCPEHLKGREHRGYKDPVLLPTPPASSPKFVIMRCPRCKHRKKVPLSDVERMEKGMLVQAEIICEKCSGIMLWHKEVKE